MLTVYTEQALSLVTNFTVKGSRSTNRSLVSFNKFLSRYLIHVFQDYSEWKRGISDLSLPTVHINRMDHLTSYVQEVTDAVEELCDLIHKSYEKKVNLTKKSCEYM